MVERVDVQARCDRCVGDDHIDLVHRQCGDEVLESAFATHEAHGTREPQGGLEDLVADLFWQNIVDPHDEPQRSLRRAMLERFDELPPETEDLVRIAVHVPPDLRRPQRAATLHEEPLAQPRLERAELRADRWSRQ
jgi:hypothetical protein